VKTPRYPPALLAMLIALPVPSSPAASRDPSWVDTSIEKASRLLEGLTGAAALLAIGVRELLH